jgi:dGTPase
MAGSAATGGITVAHKDSAATIGTRRIVARQAREELQELQLCPGATRVTGAGNRLVEEEPDPLRTCFERDRDRILHAPAFRRLAGKTQVFVFPDDHQRTRLTHALEVAQVATAVARALGLNVALVEAIALGHDCGHGPGGHASEDALSPFLPEGFDHAIWGANETLAPLNLCAETLDGIRNHSWSLPAPSTPEGEVVSWADRIAYVCHDFEDAVAAGIVASDMLPRIVRDRCGSRRSQQLRTFISAMVDAANETGRVGMTPAPAEALAAFRRFNYDNVYLRPASRAQAHAVIDLLRALVEYFADRPNLIEVPASHGVTAASPEAVRRAVSYVAGMTDRFACRIGVSQLGWEPDRLPRGIGLG